MAVKNVATGGGVVAKDRERTQGNEPKYLVELKNLGAVPEQATVEWYFFAKAIREPSVSPQRDREFKDRHPDWNKPYVHDSGKIPVAVPPKHYREVTFQIKPLLKTETITGGTTSITSGNTTFLFDSPTALEKKTSGIKAAGWLVRLVVDGRLILIAASEPSFDELGRTPDRLNAMPRKPPFEPPARKGLR